MKNYALVGYPLGHSLSPFIHSMILKHAGIQADYGLITVEQGTLQQKFETVLSKLNGFNVTIPHKVDIIPYLNQLDDSAWLCGAVNTVKQENGLFTGYNTDSYGFLMALKRSGLPLKGKVLLCGAGGAARMIAFECGLAGCALTIATRPSSIPKARKIVAELREKLGVEAKTCLLQEVAGPFDLIVNGTPAGMVPNTDGMAVSETIIRQSGAVYDTVYNPRKTRLVRTAEQFGVPSAGGMEMLVCQAIKAQQIFSGIKPEAVPVSKIVEACYGELEARA